LFDLEWTDEASSVYNSLKGDSSQKTHYKAVKKAIKLLAQNPRYKSLQTHEFKSLSGPNGEKVFEAYAEQNTPNAYRLFWYYGPDELDASGNRIATITVIAITPHPQ
jgi:hypothetical protein